MKIEAKYNSRNPLPDGVHPDYWETHPVWVADDLDDLTGPTAGLVQLPLHLEWTTRRPIRLDDPSSVLSGYATVLREAKHESDFRYLNSQILIRIWPDLFLPRKVREAWTRRFPELP
ncbi:hypothetical protein [Cryobacterium sp. GrIS_2_6]|uniref:hypothetical protein n=1 Tax=Cryobacterium sp. GrIS_2_6 TaxID=3162785 RepID=UPI002E021A1D|nr:hypothetical protein [Cryobacterium psychrotolerans]